MIVIAITGLFATSCKKDNPKPIVIGEANDKIRFVATVEENHTDSSYLDLFGADGNGALGCDEFTLQYDNSWYFFAPEYPRLLIPPSGTIIDTTFTFPDKKETPRILSGQIYQTVWSGPSTLQYGQDKIRIRIYYNDKLSWDYVVQTGGNVNVQLF